MSVSLSQLPSQSLSEVGTNDSIGKLFTLFIAARDAAIEGKLIG